ncbi:hypothetical protein [Streptomyces sp. NBC_00827]|uniref:hypothetical protein n=1 Tax=Streptomyces sp. NBC_00827 TaxID=2903677 RepID=UPI0038681374|nr:hypothetical protein OG569_10710 [Streptomyces sp. NBC_00827]
MAFSRFRLAAAVAATGAVLGLTGAAPADSGDPQDSPSTEIGYFSYEPLDADDETVGFFSDQPLPEDEVTPVSGLPSSVQRQLAGHGVVVPQADTPNGYKLRKGTRSTDYVYKSADVYAIEANCNSSGCRPVQQVKLAIKEYVRGRTSKYWEITFYGSRWSGSSQFHMDYNYECGVNIPNASDETCSTWRRDGAQGHGSGVAVNKQKIVKKFGSTAVVTKFPMVNLLVTFADGSKAIGDDGKPGEKFRGWDVCVTNTTTKLCHSTGDGS